MVTFRLFSKTFLPVVFLFHQMSELRCYNDRREVSIFKNFTMEQKKMLHRWVCIPLRVSVVYYLSVVEWSPNLLKLVAGFLSVSILVMLNNYVKEPNPLRIPHMTACAVGITLCLTALLREETQSKKWKNAILFVLWSDLFFSVSLAVHCFLHESTVPMPQT